VTVDDSKSQPKNNKLSLKGAWLRHVTHFKFLVPLKYRRNDLSKFCTLWPCEVLAFGLTNSPSCGRGYGHKTSLNFGK